MTNHHTTIDLLNEANAALAVAHDSNQDLNVAHAISLAKDAISLAARLARQSA